MEIDGGRENKELNKAKRQLEEVRLEKQKL